MNSSPSPMPCCSLIHSGKTPVNYRKIFDPANLLPSTSSDSNPKKIRAGVFLYNRKEDKLLVVQVYDEFYGLPKGHAEPNETLEQTALRELKEETGVVLPDLVGKRFTRINTVTYYIVETDECFPVKIDTFEANDVTRCGWIHIDCLYKLQKPNSGYHKGVITSNLHTMVRRVLNREIEPEEDLSIDLSKLVIV